ncbi:MAG: hydrogenase nickel incorporation protein HypB [Anaerolineales bacterium]|nr:MAG: hydrogenase nickel incorporation protein HypB [Anaerolineales bacterium]
MRIKVMQDIMAANDLIARENRRIFDQHEVFVVNLMSSPGAGKTTLLERTLVALKNEFAIAVIEGDIRGQLDAERIGRYGVPVLQINTGGECHLDANMIRNALDRLELLVIENVGNLVCPAEFKVGEDRKVMILSVPEGDDKPYKYPLMFMGSQVMVINKMDLLGMVDFDVEKVEQAVLALNPEMDIFRLSCKTGEGMEAGPDWLRGQVRRERQAGTPCW